MMVVEVSRRTRTTPIWHSNYGKCCSSSDIRLAAAPVSPTMTSDVGPDGQRFVMVKEDSSANRLNMLLNWFEELKRLAPTE